MDVGLPTHLGLGHLGRDRGLVGLDVVDKGDRDGELGLARRLYPSQLNHNRYQSLMQLSKGVFSQFSVLFPPASKKYLAK